MSKRYTIDEKVFTQVVEASKRFSSFGIEQTNFKTDYIHLYVMDMDDNILGQQYFSQDEIDVIDERVIDINVGQHLRDMGFTEGEYKVKYYFLSSIAGLPNIADGTGEYGYYYLTADQKPYFGRVKSEMVNNEQTFYYGVGEKIPLKRVENKYVLMDINSDRTEVKVDTQNINQEGRYTSYRDKLRRILQQTAYPRFNFDGSREDYHLSTRYPSPKIRFDSKDHNVLIIEPQYDGDPGFDISVVGKAISISDVYRFRGPSFEIFPTLNPQAEENIKLRSLGYSEAEIIQAFYQNESFSFRSEFSDRYNGVITEVLDYNRIRVDKSFEQRESELRSNLQVAIDRAEDAGQEDIVYRTYRNGWLTDVELSLVKNNQYITAASFTQIADPDRLMSTTTERDFNSINPNQGGYRWRARMRGNSFVVWTPQTKLENLNTYMVVDNQYYLVSQGSEGYGTDGLLYRPWEDGAPQNVLERYFKLYKPLESEIEKYSLVYFVEEKIEPYEDTIKLIPFVTEEEDLTFLRVPNINAKDNPIRQRRIQYKNFNQITGDNQEIKDKIHDKVLSGSLLDVRLNVDYGKRNRDFDNNDYGYSTFVNFGSAEKRLSNFKKKLTLIETYTSQSGVFGSISSSLENTQKFRRLKN